MNDGNTLQAADIGAILVAGAQDRRAAQREAYEKVLKICAETEDVSDIQYEVQKLIDALDD